MVVLPQKYGYIVDEGRVSAWEGIPRPMGKGFHKAMEEMYGGTGDPTFVALAEYDAAFTDDLDEERQKKVKAGRAVLERLVQNYPRDRNYFQEVLAIERDLAVDMGQGRTYAGRIDMVVRFLDSIYVHDFKTTSASNLIAMQQANALRHQYVGYTLLAREAFPDDQVVGVISELAKKPRANWLKPKPILDPEFIPDHCDRKIEQARRKQTGANKGKRLPPKCERCDEEPEIVGWHEPELSVTGECEYPIEPYVINAHQIAEFREWFHYTASQIEAGVRVRNTSSCQAFGLCEFYQACRNPKRSAEFLASERFKDREER